MTRRPLTVLAALSVGMLFYVVFVGLILHRLNQMIGVTIGMSARPAPAPNGCVSIFGVSVPIPILIVLGSILPTVAIVAEIFERVRRRNEGRQRRCLRCGHLLVSEHIRCRRCGRPTGRIAHDVPSFAVVFRKPHRN